MKNDIRFVGTLSIGLRLSKRMAQSLQGRQSAVNMHSIASGNLDRISLIGH